jgi:hypothetical protein
MEAGVDVVVEVEVEMEVEKMMQKKYPDCRCCDRFQDDELRHKSVNLLHHFRDTIGDRCHLRISAWPCLFLFL